MGSISSEKKDLAAALRRHREILRWETSLLKTEITSRNLATIAGKKAYLKRHHSEGDGRPQTCAPPPQLVDQNKIVSLPLVSLPYLADNHEDALDLLLHETHKLGYRLQSLRQLGVPIPLEKLRLLFLMSQECLRVCKSIARHGSPPSSCKSSEDAEISIFKERRLGWESTWGSPVFRCGGFNDITTLSPLHFTSPPGFYPSFGYSTMALQIYSFKIFDLNDNLKWPLYVYGVVAARDDVDSNRNLLFSRSRANWQVVTKKDPFLRLTGPSRAILADDVVDFEVELKIKDGTYQSQDKALISSTYHHNSSGCTARFPGHSCSAELRLETLPLAVQATILSVRVCKGRWPFECGGRVACSSSFSKAIDPTCEQVVLLDCVEKIPEDGLDGYLPLSRNVVSVELRRGLEVGIQAYRGSGSPSGSGLVYFPPETCNVSQGRCLVLGSEVEVTVAWSRLVRDKMYVLS